MVNSEPYLKKKKKKRKTQRNRRNNETDNPMETNFKSCYF